MSMSHALNHRALWTALAFAASVVCLAHGGRAQAQDAAPALAMEDLLLPLVTAAEADAGAGRSALAIARARLVLASLPPTSSLRVRAQGVDLVSTQALGTTPYVEPSADEVLAPLVDTAEGEAQRGLPAVAVARLDFALARVAPEGPLGVRARGLRDAAVRTVAPTSTPPATGYGGPSAYGGYAPAPAAALTSPQIVVPSGAGAGPGATPYHIAPVQVPEVEPRDPTEPGTGEIVQLYISMGMLGALTGFYIPFAAGMNGRDFDNDSGRLVTAYSLSMLLGGGVGAIGAFALAQTGLRTGGPGTISVGFRWGFAMGMLTMGTMINGPFTQAEYSTALWGSAVGGTLLGLTLAYTVQPTAHQAHFIEPGGLWGAGLGGLFAAIVASEVRSTDASGAFGLTLAGMGVGLLTHIIMAATTDVSTGRGWLMAGGFAIGVAAASLIPAFGMLLTGDGFSPLLFGVFGSIFGLTGLIIAAIFSEGMGAPRRSEGETAGFEINFGVAPAPEGGMATVSGRF